MKRFNNNQILKKALVPMCALIIFIITAFTGQQVKAQSVYTLALGSQISVAGTSNLHDWTMNASKFSVDGKLTVVSGQLKDINSLVFVLPVKNLKSKESLMDTRAYKTLNVETHDKMIFKLTGATVVEAQKIVKVTGNLTIAGVTKAIALQANYTVAADESVTFKGSKAIKMSDFKIKAPSFMMGALKTGDDLIINITLKLKK
ncbi:MAG TPA: YceI family protein [Pelobium sp.]|nr:YceI family protein [Pelobium sp.]